MSWVLENFPTSGPVLRRTHVQGDSGRGYLLAFDVVASARRARVIRALAVAGAVLVATGIGLPAMACAQSGGQGGGAIGLLLFLSGGARRDPSVSKQNPGVRASDEAKGKNINVKQGRPPAKNGTSIARVGDEAAPTIPDKVASQSKLHQDSIIPVAHYEKNHR
jgi:hypothetical protein